MPLELITFMKRITGSPELPKEITIVTRYNEYLFGEGSWKTQVFNSQSRSLMGACASIDLPDRQHEVVVGFYAAEGYYIIAQLGTSAQQPGSMPNESAGQTPANAGLERLLEGIPGFDQL